MSNVYYLAIDEKKDVSIHSTEPHYNTLFGRWRSLNGGTYVSKNMVSMMVANPISDNLIKACCYELDVITINDNKQISNNIKKIYN